MKNIFVGFWATAVLTASASISFAAPSTRNDRPCAPFLKACLDAGFSIERTEGNGISELSSCVDRLVRGEKFTAVSGLLAQAPPDADPRACKAKRAAVLRR